MLIPQKRSKGKYLIIVLIFLITIFLSIYSKYKHDVYTPLNKDDKSEISLIIKEGDSVRKIADNLEKKGISQNSFAFYWYSRLNGFDTKIIRGRFLLSPSMNIPEILSIISDVKKSEAVITIREGLKISNIDKLLAALGSTKEGDFAVAIRNFKDFSKYTFLDQETLRVISALPFPLEGYIYPDTYFLEPTDTQTEDLIYKALNNFSKKITPYLAEITTSKHSLEEILTVASIIEKEVNGKEDREIVSGILWKRLASGWKLDADATLLYLSTDNKISKTDLNSNSPYNTRKFKGLPPGPICNPSIGSILAALHPKSSNYWFYLTAKNGSVKYAATNKEHNKNKAEFL